MSYKHPLSSDINLYIPDRIAEADARRQTETAREVLRRLQGQPGVILADEVGMGKTFVALAVAVSVALSDPGRRPVVVMVPPSLKEKWPREFQLFREKCLPSSLADRLRHKSADRAIDFLKLLDDPASRKSNLIFLTHGAMSRNLHDGWVKLALIQRALHGRHHTEDLRRALCRVMGPLLSMQWVQYRDPDVWEKLLATPPADWLSVLQRRQIDPEGDNDPLTDDDPVPESVRKVLGDLDTSEILDALTRVPYRQSKYFEENLQDARNQLRVSMKALWRECVTRLRLRLPLLVLDEAHHLKNEQTLLASLFHLPDAKDDADEISRGALGGVFERMLFLTATPFQLGHGELCSVLERFDGISWRGDRAPSVSRETFQNQVAELRRRLDKAQELALTLDKTWGLLKNDDLALDGKPQGNVDVWWEAVRSAKELPLQASRVAECYSRTHQAMREAEEALKPWVIRHLKARHLPPPNETQPRRIRLAGRAILPTEAQTPDTPGLCVDGRALLPFLLAARATACTPDSRPVFAEGLASSYEAFLYTRSQRQGAGHAATDGDDDLAEVGEIDAVGRWYLDQLSELLPRENTKASAAHPKVAGTVERVLDLWRKREKVVVFCHYIATGHTLRRRISEAVSDEINRMAAQKLGCEPSQASGELTRLGRRFFDTDSPQRQACNAQVIEALKRYPALKGREAELVEAVRRIVRTPSFLSRYMPLERGDLTKDAVDQAFNTCDASQQCLRTLLDHFFEFLVRCGEEDRKRYVEAILKVQTGSHLGSEALGSFGEDELEDDRSDSTRTMLVPNVRLVNGAVRQDTRQRLMLTFNTPFYPEVLVASSVMAEGVDLHLNCRHVIHHDLCWNPSTLEQRTGRIDRIGAKAERCGQPIQVYLPYMLETQDEKMYRVVMDRERWFSVVMGEHYKVDARSTEKLANRVPFPESAATELAFRLSVLEEEQ